MVPKRTAGELEIFVLLAACLAIAWLVPGLNAQADEPFSSRVFWVSVFVGLLVALAIAAARAAWRWIRGA
jgi:small basic protein